MRISVAVMPVMSAARPRRGAASTAAPSAARAERLWSILASLGHALALAGIWPAGESILRQGGIGAPHPIPLARRAPRAGRGSVERHAGIARFGHGVAARPVLR